MRTSRGMIIALMAMLAVSGTLVIIVYFALPFLHRYWENFTSVVSEEDEDKASWHAWEGELKLREDDYDGAIAKANLALALNPEESFALRVRADAYVGKKEYGRAVEDYTRSIEIWDGEPMKHYNRGVALVNAGDFKAAVKDFTHILNSSRHPLVEKAVGKEQYNAMLESDRYFALSARGYAYSYLDMHSEAIADWEAAAEVAKTLPEESVPSWHREAIDGCVEQEKERMNEPKAE